MTSIFKPWKWPRNVRLYSMLFLTTIFFFIELITGYAVGSVALIADAFHMLSDVLSLIVALYAIKLAANQNYHPQMTYGFQRAEILGALTNGVFLLALCFTIIIESIQRFIRPEEIDNPLSVLYVGSAGLVVNLLGLVLFHEHSGHSHSHQSSDQHSHATNDDHDREIEEFENLPEFPISARIEEYKRQITSPVEIEIDITSKEANSNADSSAGFFKQDVPVNNKVKQHKDHQNHDHGHLNMHGVFLHVLGDALGSIAVIISAIVIQYTPEGSIFKTITDPLLSLLITCIILFTTIPLIKNTSYILLQGLPMQLRGKVPTIKQDLKKIDGVINVHELHIWQLSDSKWVSTVHVTVHPSVSEIGFMDLAKKIKSCLHSYGIHIATVQPEFLSTLNADNHIQQSPEIIQNDLTDRNKPNESVKMDYLTDSTNFSEQSCLLSCEQQNCPQTQAQCCPTDSAKSNK